MMLRFPPWRYDNATPNTPFARDVRNVLVRGADDNGVLYAPMPDFATLSDAANGQVLGGAGFTLADGTSFTVVGTADRLYQVDTSDNTLTDISGGSYNATVAAPWDFTNYGDNIIATNATDGPQRFIVGTDSAFSDLAGTPTHGHYVSVWKDQLVIGALSGNLEGVQWSEINDITDWTGGNSDTQVFPGFGRVTGISRGNTPLVVQESGIQRGVFTGTDRVFEFDTLVEDLGCRVPQGTAFRGNTAYFWSDFGFKSVSTSGEVRSIGYGKVDDWVREFVDVGSDSGMTAAADPQRPLIYWGVQSTENAGSGLNALLAYNFVLGEWTVIDISVEALFSWRTGGFTLESLDSVAGSIDDLPFSLDSSAWKADIPVIGGANASHLVGQFSGAPMAARMRTGEVAFAEGRRTRARQVRPIIDGPASVKHIGRENRAATPKEFGPEPVFERTQEARINRKARFHEFEVQTDAAASWTLASGVEVDVRV